MDTCRSGSRWDRRAAAKGRWRVDSNAVGGTVIGPMSALGRTSGLELAEEELARLAGELVEKVRIPAPASGGELQSFPHSSCISLLDCRSESGCPPRDLATLASEVRVERT